MCVIIVKPVGIELPDRNTLERAAIFNPHGFGFCTGGKLFKTLSFRVFVKELYKIDISESCIIHFRYATTGSVKRANCHPFEANGIYFAHNGVINVRTKNDMTDSETFFRDYFIPAVNQYGYNSEILQLFINSHSGFSRFAMMKNKEISMYGDFQKFEGCYYSNLRFLNLYY